MLQGCRATGTRIHCWWEISNITATLENGLALPYQFQHKITILLSHFSLRYLPKSNENIRPHKDLYTKVHGSFVHNSLKIGNNTNTH